MRGGAGDDAIYGEAGSDTIFGGSGDDILSGGAGDDGLFGQAGGDYLVGGAGSDDLISGGQTGDKTVAEDIDYTPASAATKPGPQSAAGFGNGVHQVGVDIQPGTYASAGPAESGRSCYWARLRKTENEYGSNIIDNDVVREGQALVTILASDWAFESSGCLRWLRR